MADRLSTARLWAETLSDPTDERKAALRELVADDVEAVSPLGANQGRRAVLDSLGASPIAGFLARATWAEPADDGTAVTVTCALPPGAPVGGLSVRFGFDPADRVTRVETGIIPAAAPEAGPVDLTGGVADAVNGALANGTPVVVAYVDPEGRPRLSLRGSTQVTGPDQVAIWVRDPRGGLLAAIPGNPNLTLFYRDPATRTSYHVQGTARVETDEAVRQRVYAASPEPERNLDPQRNGVAVIIDVDRVQGRGPSGPVLMERGAG